MTDSERRRIFGLSKQLGMTSDELHLLVAGVTGKDSIRALDSKDTSAVIAELNARRRSCDTIPEHGTVTVKRYKTRADGGMTQSQCRKAFAQICELIELDGQEYTSEEAYRRLNGAIKKITGNSMGTRREPFYGLSCEDGRELIDMLKRYIYSAEKRSYRHKKGAANG